MTTNKQVHVYRVPSVFVILAGYASFLIPDVVEMVTFQFSFLMDGVKRNPN